MYFPILLVDMIHDSNESENLVDIIMDIMVDFRCLFLYALVLIYTSVHATAAESGSKRREARRAPCALFRRKKGGE
jgi:hypothetical protein